MTAKKKPIPLTETQIDDAVVAQVGNDAAWGKGINVKPYDRELSLRMPAELLRRIRLQARKDGFSHIEDWVMNLLTNSVKQEYESHLINEKAGQYAEEKQLGLKK